MTVYSFWQQSLATPAAVARKLASLLMPTADGVLADDNLDALLVRAQTTPNMSVRVNAGWAKKSGYLGYSDALTTVTIPTANASNPRIDLIAMRWRDTEAGDPSSSCTLEVITGTPAASPAAPSVVGMTAVQVIAQVAVAAGTTSITGSAITDTRTRVYAKKQMETGTVTIPSVVGQQNATKLVTFQQTWAAPPMVQLTIRGGAAWAPSLVGAPSATGFTAMVAKTDGSNAGGVVNFSVDWCAMQRTDT